MPAPRHNGLRQRLSLAFGRFIDWLGTHVNVQTTVFVLAVATGLCAGAAAAMLKYAIRKVSEGFTDHFHMFGPNWALLAIPVAGILLTGLYQRKVLRADITHGVRRLGADIKSGRAAMPGYLCYAPMVASTLTLGFGGSAGSEGPIAYTGAAIGSNIGRLFRLDSHLMMIMLGCGAGAGIAGIFKAPVGGFLFTLEVLRLELTTMSVMACLLACITAAMTAYVLSGFTVDLSYIQYDPFDLHLAPCIILLGVVCGFYSLYYAYVMKTMERFYTALRRPWVRNLVSGSVLAAIIFLFPAMYGEGYDVMGDVLAGRLGSLTADSLFAHIAPEGWPIVAISAAILATKAFACSGANGGGGVAGDFAPTLFAGCVAGFFFATLLNTAFGLDLPVAGLAFCGMAGVMAGVIRAPLMALFLTAEMTDGFVLFLPLLTVTGVSYGIVRIFKPAEYYSTV